MKCVSCSLEVSAGAKFCGSCGTKLESAAAGPIQINLAPSPLSLASCSVTLLETTAVGPDDDGDIRVTARFRVENETDEDWEYLEAQMQLLDGHGLVVESTSDTYEQSLDAGDSEELESNLYGVRLKALGENADEAHVYIQVIAAKKVSRSLGRFPLTRPAYEGYALQPFEFDGYLKLLSGRLSTTDPDSDGDVRFEAKAMLQNLTADYSPKVSLTGTVSNAKGDEVLTVDASGAIQPGAVTVVSDNSFAKKKMFKGATAEMELSAYVQLAEGFASDTGLSFVAEETEEEEDEADPIDGDNGDGDASATNWKVNAAWEERSRGKAICRWFVCWKTLDDDFVVGAVAGYSGGGSFEVERFYGQLSAGELISLWVDATDRVSSDEIEFEDLAKEVLADCENALDKIWEWNNHDLWTETDEVALSKQRARLTSEEDDLLRYSDGYEPWLRKLCEMVGLTAAPLAEDEEEEED